MSSWLVHHNDVETALNKSLSSVGGTNKAVKFPLMYYAMPPVAGQGEFCEPKVYCQADSNIVGQTGVYRPTAVTHQTYLFQRPSALPVQDSESNCLLYLEMINNNGQLPADKNFLSSNGVLVTADGDPNERIKGSMAISSKVLFDSYLIPILRPIIKQAELVRVSAAPNTQSASHYEWNYRFGDNLQHGDWKDDYFLMTRQQGRDDIYDKSHWFNQRVPGMANYNGWRWINAKDVAGTAQETDGGAATLTGMSSKLTARTLVHRLGQALNTVS